MVILSENSNYYRHNSFFKNKVFIVFYVLLAVTAGLEPAFLEQRTWTAH